jgi:hypothetical protein
MVFGGIFIVVAFDDWPVLRSYNFEASSRVCIISDKVTHTDIIRAALVRSIFENRFEGFEVSMDISEQGKTHGARMSRRGELRLGKGV